ncbi:MAG: hypothetical protein IPO62_03715 [Saprospiraceae bacterium]|nr:hypothetical protein [Saprospiraceae bacterium]
MYFKKFSIFFIIFIFHLKPLFTQCPTEERIELCSQEEVQLFAELYPDCKHIMGDLIISLEVEDLRPILGIQEIDGDLEIYETYSLFNLDGLDSLRRVGGDLRIAVNLRLVDMEALTQLLEIGGGLYIYQHYNNIDSLTQINGLRNLRSVGRFISIRNNNYLSNIDGLSGLTEIPEDLRIQSNLSLKNIEGLSNLRKIGGHLRLIGLRVLQDLNGLRNLEEVGDQTTIMGLSAIKDLKPLNKLKTLGGKLQINLNPELTTLDGIKDIDHWTISELIIRDNIKLDYCHVQSICAWIKNRQSQPYDVDHNLGDCDTYEKIETACSSVGTIDVQIANMGISYTNPVEDILHIRLIEPIPFDLKIQLFNSMGGLCFEFTQIHSENISIPISHLPSGHYYFRIYADHFSKSYQWVKL